jgi:hypothetical protein
MGPLASTKFLASRGSPFKYLLAGPFFPLRTFVFVEIEFFPRHVYDNISRHVSIRNITMKSNHYIHMESSQCYGFVFSMHRCPGAKVTRWVYEEITQKCGPTIFCQKLCITKYLGKRGPKMRATSVIFEHCPKYINYRPTGENSPNLVTQSYDRELQRKPCLHCHRCSWTCDRSGVLRHDPFEQGCSCLNRHKNDNCELWRWTNGPTKDRLGVNVHMGREIEASQST